MLQYSYNTIQMLPADHSNI